MSMKGFSLFFDSICLTFSLAIMCFLMMWATTSQTWACSPPVERSTLSKRSIFPASGRLSVPTNTRVLFDFDFRASTSGAGLGLDAKVLQNVQIRPKGGTALAVTAESGVNGSVFGSRVFVLVKPKQPLKPNTVYEVLAPIATVPCEVSQGGCDLKTLHVVSTFTTGKAKDSKAPIFGGLQALKGTKASAKSDSCFDTYEAGRIPFSWKPAKGDHSSETVRYHVYDSSDLSKPLLSFVTSDIVGWINCKGRAPVGSWKEFVLKPSTSYMVRAVDLAGNEETNTIAQTPSYSCASKTPAPKTPAPKTPAPKSSAPKSGVACSIRQNDGSFGGLLGLCFLLLVCGCRRKTSRL